jgi:drug/metabolite transporter (DMT)-like permease
MDIQTIEPKAGLSINQGRVLVVLAAVLWSLSGAFTKILTKQATFQLDGPPITAVQIAFFRVFFAGLVLLPLLRRQDITFRWSMPAMVLCFALMNATFVPALALGTAANAILLQYSAPLWMYLASIYLLREAPDRRGAISLAIGLCGIAIILCGGWQDAQFQVIAIALASGVTYAGVILFLRVLRGSSSSWLTVINHLGGALFILPALWYFAPEWPGTGQMILLFLFGAVQMALPYYLMAKGMRVVSAQEAGAITLLEPLLNPLWAYLVAPEVEQPRFYTMLGGAFILGGLFWRYWPSRKGKEHTPDRTQ